MVGKIQEERIFQSEIDTLSPKKSTYEAIFVDLKPYKNFLEAIKLEKAKQFDMVRKLSQTKRNVSI